MPARAEDTSHSAGVNSVNGAATSQTAMSVSAPARSRQPCSRPRAAATASRITAPMTTRVHAIGSGSAPCSNAILISANGLPHSTATAANRATTRACPSEGATEMGHAYPRTWPGIQAMSGRGSK
jgi:hypothetical protein